MTWPSPLTVVQRTRHGVRDVQTDDAIAQIQRYVARRAVDGAEQARYSGGSLHQVVVHGLAGIGAAGAVAHRGAVHDVGIEGLDVLVVQAQPPQTLGPDIRDENVGVARQCEGAGVALRRFQIQYDAALIPVGL